MKITICGSTQFEPAWHEISKKLALAGHICYSLSAFPSIEGAKVWYNDNEKELLDLIHLAKIEESDAIVVVNQGGYVGDSTRREVMWAQLRRKPVYWLHSSTHHQENISVLLGPR